MIVPVCFSKILKYQLPPQILAAFLGNLNLLSSGIQTGWSSPSLPKLTADDSYISLTEYEIGWLPMSVPIGALCGGILTGFFTNKIGRKPVILLANVIFIACALLTALANSFSMLVIGRLLGGIADGISFSSVPIYVAETSDPKIRGILLSGTPFAWSCGILFINIVGSYVSIPCTAYVSLAIAVITLTTFAWMPETPHYLVMKGKSEEARMSLKAFQKSKDVESLYQDIVSAVKSHDEETKSLTHLFTVKSNRKSIIIMLGITFVQQFCGASCIIFYGHTIFEKAGSTVSPETTAIIYFSLFVVLSGVCGAIVERTGRKPLIIVSTVGVGIAVLVLATYYYLSDILDMPGYISVLPLVTFLLYIIFYTVGIYSVGILITGEVLPVSIRSVGEGLYIVFYNVSGIIILQLFEVFQHTYGLYVLFYIFGVCCALGLLFIIFYVPETGGITLEEIESKMRS